MALVWFNIRSKEIRVAESDPMISAMYNSSNLGPNASQGQDFGWRLAPEVVVQMKGIKQDPMTLERIANRARVLVEDVDDKMILAHISGTSKSAQLEEQTLDDFEDDYREQIRQLEAIDQAKKNATLEEVQAPKEETNNGGKTNQDRKA